VREEQRTPLPRGRRRRTRPQAAHQSASWFEGRVGQGGGAAPAGARAAPERGRRAAGPSRGEMRVRTSFSPHSQPAATLCGLSSPSRFSPDSARSPAALPFWPQARSLVVQNSVCVRPPRKVWGGALPQSSFARATSLGHVFGPPLRVPLFPARAGRPDAHPSALPRPASLTPWHPHPWGPAGWAAPRRRGETRRARRAFCRRRRHPLQAEPPPAAPPLGLAGRGPAAASR